MPSNYYGFSPMMKNRGATIAAVGAGIGQTIASLPGIIREEKKFKYDEAQRQKAIEAIQADSALADDAYKAFKEQYKNRAQPLVEAGLMTQDQVDSNLRTIPMLRESDKLDTKSLNSFIERQGSTIANLYKELTNVESKMREKKRGEEVGADVRKSIYGQEANILPGQGAPESPGQTVPAFGGGERTAEGELQLPGREMPQFGQGGVGMTGRAEGQQYMAPAETREQAFGRAAQMRPGITTGEFEQRGGKYLPTQMDKDKLAAQMVKWSEDLKLKYKKMRQQQAEQASDDFTKESNALFSNATRYENITNTTQKQLADTEEKINELTTEDSKLRAKLTDPESIWMPGEQEQAKAELNQIEKDRQAAEDRMVKLNERLINQSEKKVIADKALEIYIQTKGRVGYKGAMKYGQEASQEIEKPQPKEGGGEMQKPYSYSPLGKYSTLETSIPLRPPEQTPALSGQTGGWKQYGKYKIRQKQ